jgi:hypothetical protein
MAAPREVARSNPNEPDKRVAASVTLLGVLICASLGFALTPRAANGPAAAAVAGNRLAEATPRLVKIVDGPARSEVCAQQTWPHFDARCLARKTESAPAEATPAPQPAAQAGIRF